MFLYQLKLVVTENKLDEFVDSLRYLSSGIRKEQGCLDFSLCRDFQKKNAYRVLGEWKTRLAMEGHFKRAKFSVLIGAARVLGEDFEMSIGETLEKGCYQFAQEKISPHPGKDKMLDSKPQTDLKLEVVNGE
jgi:quinol monooxygenase YgiN